MTNGFGNHYSNKVREMKVLVTGVGGQLGHDVIKELEKSEFDIPVKPILRIATNKDVANHQKNLKDIF